MKKVLAKLLVVCMVLSCLMIPVVKVYGVEEGEAPEFDVTFDMNASKREVVVDVKPPANMAWMNGVLVQWSEPTDDKMRIDYNTIRQIAAAESMKNYQTGNGIDITVVINKPIDLPRDKTVALGKGVNYILQAKIVENGIVTGQTQTEGTVMGTGSANLALTQSYGNLTFAINDNVVFNGSSNIPQDVPSTTSVSLVSNQPVGKAIMEIDNTGVTNARFSAFQAVNGAIIPGKVLDFNAKTNGAVNVEIGEFDQVTIASADAVNIRQGASVKRMNIISSNTKVENPKSQTVTIGEIRMVEDNAMWEIDSTDSTFTPTAIQVAKKNAEEVLKSLGHNRYGNLPRYDYSANEEDRNALFVQADSIITTTVSRMTVDAANALLVQNFAGDAAWKASLTESSLISSEQDSPFNIGDILNSTPSQGEADKNGEVDGGVGERP